MRLHDLRHSFAATGAGAGFGLPILGAILGHSQAATTHRYAHVAEDPRKATADQIASSIQAALDGKSGTVVEFEKQPEKERP